MPRKGPTTGAKPHRDDHSHFAEDLWVWFNRNRNVVFLCLTILVIGGIVFIIRTRTAGERQMKAQAALGRYFYQQTDKKEQMKRLQANLTQYDGYRQLTPWFYIQLADAHYLQKQYNKAIQNLHTVNDQFPEQEPTKFSKRFIESIRREKKFMKKGLEQKKNDLKARFDRKRMVFGIETADVKEITSTRSN